ncbi:hypothetical protein [Rhizobium rhizogenes]|uniref:Uncharacterized protein n=1 Tax=Rhizobium rhizogenes TaxID=359 RepID=A0AA92C4T4_RHIRH|nr:hypothetical protein [Rhizobium rhizogenes]PVE55329.1 hypothetical protein DC430_09005 [Rhizobium rhizogenes]PVE65749.1 hypothetical protein DC415_12485 [Agrobacterium tumefaciens]PVE75813.1 hypothetical protein DCP16_12485 [Sphingomonas sp. TPD3009]
MCTEITENHTSARYQAKKMDRRDIFAIVVLTIVSVSVIRSRNRRRTHVEEQCGGRQTATLI